MNTHQPQETASHAALELNNVHVHIGDHEILRGVSVELRAGRATGLVGESGSGKTMCVRTATGTLKKIRGQITSGNVRILGKEMTAASGRDWTQVRGHAIALVPQNSLSSLDPIMTVGKQLRETIIRAAGHKDWRSEANRLLRLVHLHDVDRILNAYPQALSGGMRQRVVIALALAVRPSILLADEPTTALDASVRAEILELLTELRLREGLALLLVSHDLAAIRSATDDVIVMHRGRTVEAGATAAVIEHPQHPYTQSLLLARPELNEPGQPIPLVPVRESHEPVVHSAIPAPASDVRKVSQ
ncbi:MAG: ABC transporter ATP-binding protein [Nocardioidaceae bacterium]|nr:ABC transporter ATP-binding protein [Nocardioidaceae bacterium]